MARECVPWRGGSLEKDLQGNGRVVLELQWAPDKGAEQRRPSPDFEVDSENSVWLAQNSHVDRMTWFFSFTQP
jgi:hypothetical protein